jgi:hypothetical protein
MEAKYFFLPERRRRTALHYIKKNKREKFPESTRKTLLNRTHTDTQRWRQVSVGRKV